MDNGTQPVIQTIALTKIYKDFWGRRTVRALDGLDLAIRPGEVFGLLGPNGSGKTTTVKLLLGLLFPTQGVVRVFGKSPRDVEVKNRIGYMPEESHLYDYLNAKETLDFFGRLFGLPRRDRQQRTEALIDMVGLGRARSRAIGEFSKGMARRIGLAQALINDPDLLILDEPTTGLDPIGAKEMKDLIATLRERGKTIFLCSHLLADVEQICDRIGILYGGGMRTCGEVGELLTEDGRMQMRIPSMPPERLEELKEAVKKYATDDEGFEITASERRLEDFFLGVVRQAKKEQVQTAGAESGSGAAEFLSAKEPSPEDLIEDLTRAGKKQADGQEQPSSEEAEPAPEEEDQREDTDFIEQLAAEKATKEKEDDPVANEEKNAPAATPEDGGVRYDLLEELEKKGRKEEEHGDGDGEQGSEREQ